MNQEEYNKAVQALESIILDKVNEIPYTVMENAPDTVEGMIDYYNRHGQLAIYSGGCTKTIFSAPAINHAFRAIHDSRHILIGATFTLQDEKRLALYQAREFARWAIEEGYSQEIAINIYCILLCEIYYQRLYAERYNRFVDNQKRFATMALINN